MSSSNLHKNLLQSGLSGMLPPKMPKPHPEQNRQGRTIKRTKDYTPLPWNNYFNKRETIEVQEKEKFLVYRGASSDTNHDCPLVVFLHGGGYSALTWAVLCKELISKVGVETCAIDLRGHGDSVTSNDIDLSYQTLSQDVSNVTNAVLSSTKTEGRPIILVGHSMGGAIAVHASLSDQWQNLVGLCVIDVVEGTALDALATMPSYLRSRPSKFKSLDFAIEWSVRSGQVRNTESARVSMPGQLKSIENGLCATAYVGKEDEEFTSRNEPHSSLALSSDTIIEEDETLEEQQKASDPKAQKEAKPESCSSKPDKGFSWRIDLEKTEPHWEGWFKGLSSKFLSVPAAKLLLLAGVDRLDKDLTIGQMQGKFQMQVLPQAGHAIHEDLPDKVADVLATFLVRNKFAIPKEDFHRTFPAC